MDIAASHIRALWSYQVASEPDPAILKVDYTENTVMFKIEKNKQTLKCCNAHQITQSIAISIGFCFI